MYLQYSAWNEAYCVLRSLENGGTRGMGFSL